MSISVMVTVSVCVCICNGDSVVTTEYGQLRVDRNRPLR